nr:hypothetical protein [candidate division Zixibacteria bacterium]
MARSLVNRGEIKKSPRFFHYRHSSIVPDRGALDIEWQRLKIDKIS